MFKSRLCARIYRVVLGTFDKTFIHISLPYERKHLFHLSTKAYFHLLEELLVVIENIDNQ